jgi:hypothetical protein
MEPKFSPGPWAYDKNNKTVYLETSGQIICKVNRPNTALDDGNLIAASPELYEALKDEHKKHSQVKCPDICKICKILEKAEGFGESTS